MIKLSSQSRQILDQAFDEAAELKSSTMEAEHILLAISRQETNGGRKALLEFGLDHAALVEGLRAGHEQSLRAIGIDLEEFGDLDWTDARQKRRPKWGASAKLVVKRAAERIAISKRGRRIDPVQLLLSLLQAREGTVPRMLKAIEIDRQALVSRVEADMAA